ncbi:MAG: hypothetical protein GY927_09370, partial [bacterium]|nr:hypothetical protein [bacterium]
MSNEALNWAFGVDCKPATAKFVLVAMADAAGKTGCSYQAVSTLSMRTNLNRKTVLKSIKTLIKHDLIEDTGEKIGRTKSVI